MAEVPKLVRWVRNVGDVAVFLGVNWLAEKCYGYVRRRGFGKILTWGLLLAFMGTAACGGSRPVPPQSQEPPVIIAPSPSPLAPSTVPTLNPSPTPKPWKPKPSPSVAPTPTPKPKPRPSPKASPTPMPAPSPVDCDKAKAKCREACGPRTPGKEPWESCEKKCDAAWRDCKNGQL